MSERGEHRYYDVFTRFVDGHWEATFESPDAQATATGPNEGAAIRNAMRRCLKKQKGSR